MDTVVQARGGRGFVIATEEARYVVTAAHCLPDPAAAAYTHERTCREAGTRRAVRVHHIGFALERERATPGKGRRPNVNVHPCCVPAQNTGAELPMVINSATAAPMAR
jgi:hypothetical protein